MSTTIRICEDQIGFKEVTVDGKNHTVTVETLTEIVSVPFGTDIVKFTDELERLCRNSYLIYSDCGFEGEIVGTDLMKIIDDYKLIKLGEIYDDDFYKVVVAS